MLLAQNVLKFYFLCQEIMHVCMSHPHAGFGAGHTSRPHPPRHGHRPCAGTTRSPATSRHRGYHGPALGHQRSVHVSAEPGHDRAGEGDEDVCVGVCVGTHPHCLLATFLETIANLDAVPLVTTRRCCLTQFLPPFSLPPSLHPSLSLPLPPPGHPAY